jgi:hypothetical protein
MHPGCAWVSAYWEYAAAHYASNSAGCRRAGGSDATVAPRLSAGPASVARRILSPSEEC